MSPVPCRPRRTGLRPASLCIVPLLLLALALPGRVKAQPLTAADAAGLELSASSPEHVAGTFIRNGVALSFDAAIQGDRRTLALLDGAGLELYSGIFGRSSFQQNLLGGRARIEGTLNAAGETTSSKLTGDESAVEALKDRAEYGLLPQLSRALGARGLTGRSHPAALGLHMLGLAAAKNQPAEPALAPAAAMTPVEQRILPKLKDKGQCFDQQGDPCHDDCFGMCGKGCSCWSWVCGDCCVNIGCLAHDRACSSCWCGKGRCATCYFPVWVFALCDYQPVACPDGEVCPTPTVVAAPLARQKSPLSALNVNGTLEAFYLDVHNHVAMVWWQNNRWNYRDLTQTANAPAAANDSSLTAVVAGNNSQVFFQISGSNAVGQIQWTGSAWTYSNLTTVAVAPSAAYGSALASVVTGSNPHVYFLGTNNHVYELYWTGSTWAPTDLVANAGSSTPTAISGSGLTSIVIGGNVQVYYQIANNNAVAGLSYGGGGWKFSNPTQSAGAPTPAVGTVLASEATGNSNPHVFYVGTDGNVYELYDGSQWIYNNTNQQAGAPGAHAGSGLAAIPTNNQTHIYYEGPEGLNLYELYYTGKSYQPTNLTSTTRAAPPAIDSALAVTTVQSYAHVYYLSSARMLYEIYYNGGGWVYDAVTKPQEP